MSRNSVGSTTIGELYSELWLRTRTHLYFARHSIFGMFDIKLMVE